MPNKPEKSGLQAIIEAKCPRCRQGNMFVYSSFLPGKFAKMHHNCPNCGVTFEPETGFYIGAMYVSYGFGVGILAVIFVALNVFANDPPTWVYMLIVTFSLLLSVPFSYRYSRVLYLHWFGGIDYDKKAGKAV